MKISVSKKGDNDLMQSTLPKLPKIVDLAENEDNNPMAKKRMPHRIHSLMRDL
jgi:hypothetical protein